jgi:hypothetical protein
MYSKLWREVILPELIDNKFRQPSGALQPAPVWHRVHPGRRTLQLQLGERGKICVASWTQVRDAARGLGEGSMVSSAGDCPHQHNNNNKMKNRLEQEATELLALTETLLQSHPNRRAFEATFKRIEAEIMRLRKETK